MEKKLYILTGPIHSGKTTSLFKFVNGQNSIDGILSPIVNDERKLYHVSSRAIRNFEVSESSDQTISVGKYHFIRESFNWANELLKESYDKQPEWLLIDELGKLELKREGFYKSTSNILEKRNESKTKLLLVVRDYLLKDMMEFFNISDNEYKIIEIE